MKRLTAIYRILALTLLLSVSLLSTQAQSRKVEDINAFIETIVSKNTMHIDDTMRITYRLYTEDTIDRVLELNLPYLKQYFYTTTMRNVPHSSDVEIGGVVYKVLDLYTVILQGKAVGLKELPEGSVTLQYAEPTGERLQDSWGNEYEKVIYRKKTLVIKPITVEVHDMITI